MVEKHQIYALPIFLCVVLYLLLRDGVEQSFGKLVALSVTLLMILFYRVIARFSGWGFPEVLARDYGSQNRPEPYAVFFWLLFLIVCLVSIVN